jgi:putative restriction endonuclease
MQMLNLLKSNYDSNVPNHLKVDTGDLLFLRDQDRLLGFGRIGQIRSFEASKTILRCPVCRTSQIYRCRDLQPAFYCREHKAIAEPIQELISVRRYEADYSRTYTPVTAGIWADDLRTVCVRYNRQLSIQQVDQRQIAHLLSSRLPALKNLIDQFMDNLTVGPGDAAEDHPEFDPLQSGDRRAHIFRTIRERRGQSSFRDKLIRRYGQRCVVSGCDILAILEAAHICPYRGSRDHHVDNGLLLRADLHTLFDLDLLGIDPDSLTVYLHTSAAQSGYETFATAGCNIS